MNPLPNRTALFAAILTTALITLGCKSSEQASSSSTQLPLTGTFPPTRESQAAMTPQQALAELKAGNARFASGHTRPRNHLADVKATTAGQYHLLSFLVVSTHACPLKLVLNQGIGDIFSARVAGNILEDEILGSMEFGCKVAGSKLIAVIGHSNCGAVEGAIDNVDLGSLTALLARIKPAISQVAAGAQQRDSKDLEFVDKVAEANVRLVMAQVRERSPVLRELLDQGKIGLVGGMYDLSTGQIRFLE
jgi:carbonic anhydrase